ncbi:MAG: hypothetical protein ACKOC1_09510 [Hyphomicrobiales bacterium]
MTKVSINEIKRCIRLLTQGNEGLNQISARKLSWMAAASNVFKIQAVPWLIAVNDEFIIMKRRRISSRKM